MRVGFDPYLLITNLPLLNRVQRQRKLLRKQTCGPSGYISQILDLEVLGRVGARFPASGLPPRHRALRRAGKRQSDGQLPPAIPSVHSQLSAWSVPPGNVMAPLYIPCPSRASDQLPLGFSSAALRLVYVTVDDLHRKCQGAAALQANLAAKMALHSFFIWLNKQLGRVARFR